MKCIRISYVCFLHKINKVQTALKIERRKMKKRIQRYFVNKNNKS